ncbi:hypothetical protein [Brevundimonas sp.]|uniref:hypothetical protein n=1 Tax=Brevundimonas sp. TaxID=1871086 RepID=UPI003918A0C0
MIGIAFLAASLCSALDGAAAIWDREARYIVVGEMHGTREAPAAFAGLVCEAASQGPVTVALEFSAGIQPQLDAFLDAPDDASATAILRETSFWNLERADGRSSLAMLEMMLSIRRLKAEGRDIALAAFLPDTQRPPGFDQNYHELEMAALLAQAAMGRPESRVLVLVGNVHAARIRLEDFDLLPAAAHLPAAETLSLAIIQQGGSSWSCSAEACGPQDRTPLHDQNRRGIDLTPIRDGAYDGSLAIGPTTPSPPAAEQ